jgi:hypothetical protein
MSSQLIALFIVIALLFCLVWFLFGKGYPKLHTQKTRYRRNHSRRTVIEQGETQRNFEAAETEDELKQHRKDR